LASQGRRQLAAGGSESKHTRSSSFSRSCLFGCSNLFVRSFARFPVFLLLCPTQVVRRARRAQHDVLLGRLRANKILAASRIKRWWMAPSWPLVAGQVPIETQFALVGLPDGAGYAVARPQCR
jgi:hypothetical protein